MPHFKDMGFPLGLPTRRLFRAIVVGRRRNLRQRVWARPAGSGPARARCPAVLPCAADAARNRRPPAPGSSVRGWPMPRRRRQKSGVPSRAWMSFRPLWPPLPPPCLRRMPPGGRSSSSWMTRISSGVDLVEIGQRRHRLAGTVHEGGRFEQPGFAGARGLAEELGLRGERHLQFVGQVVDKPEADVVPGGFVFAARGCRDRRSGAVGSWRQVRKSRRRHDAGGGQCSGVPEITRQPLRLRQRRLLRSRRPCRRRRRRPSRPCCAGRA